MNWAGESEVVLSQFLSHTRCILGTKSSVTIISAQSIWAAVDGRAAISHEMNEEEKPTASRRTSELA